MNKKAEIINKAINKQIKPIECNPNCIYWKFDHLDRPCILSEVYGASAKGLQCYDYELKEKTHDNIQSNHKSPEHPPDRR